jgi:hypothetical protein
VTGARFQLATGAMTFRATVNSRVGDQVTAQTRTAPASVSYDASASRLRVGIGSFVVPLQSAGTAITQVDVADLYGLAMPIEPQELAIPLLDGGTRDITARVDHVTAQYRPGSVLMTIDLGYVSGVAPRPRHPRLGVSGPIPAPLDPTGLPSTATGTVRLYESALDDLAGTIEPLRAQGSYKFETGCTCVPVVGCGCAVSVTCDYTVTVSGVKFTVRPEGVSVDGSVQASWCSIPFSAALHTTADVSYVRSVSIAPGLRRALPSRQSVQILVSPTSIQPVFRIRGYDAKLPIKINVAPPLSWKIPLGTSLFHFHGAGDEQTLRLSPTQILLLKRPGYLETQAHVSLW